jgi:putative hemolysin
MEILLFIVLVIANALFALVEMSLAASRPFRLQAMAEGGDVAAARVIKIRTAPDVFIGTTQLGLNLIAILSGMYVEGAFAPRLQNILIQWGIGEASSHTLAVVFVVSVATLLFLLFGELIPKRIAMAHPEAIAKAISGWFVILTWVTKHPLWILEKVTNAIVPMITKNAVSDPLVATSELRLVLEHSAQAGTLEASAFAIVENALDMDDRNVVAIMVPRSDILYLNSQDSQDVNLKKLRSTPYHRFLVCDGGLDTISGLFDISNAIPAIAGEAPLDLSVKLESIHYVPETLSLRETMDDLQASRKSSAIVVNEFNEVIGMVSLNDIYAAVMGDTTDETGNEWITARQPDGWYVAGIADMSSVKSALGLTGDLPGEVNDAYHTMNGFMMYMLHRMPKEADTFDFGDFAFEVCDIDGRFVDKVLVTRKKPTSI